VTPAWADDPPDYAGLLDQAKAAIAAKDYKGAKALLAQAEAAAPGNAAIIQEKDLARLDFYKGLIEWRAGDKDTAALNYWRDAIVLSKNFQPEADVLPETDGQDVFYALIGEVTAREEVALGLPEDPGDAVILVDGQRKEAFDPVLVGTHYIQLRCGEGNLVGSWYTFGAPPPDYLVLCSGGSYPIGKGGKAPKAAKPAKAPSAKEVAKAEKEAADKAAKEAAVAKAAADKEAAEKAAADKALADKAAKEAAAAKATADKEAADKAAADKATADKAAADKAAADKALADRAAKEAADKAAADKAAADKATADKAAADKATADKATADKAAADKAAADKAAADKATADEAAADKATADKAAADKATADKAAADKATADKAAADKATADKAAKATADRAAADKAAADKTASDKATADKAASDKAAKAASDKAAKAAADKAAADKVTKAVADKAPKSAHKDNAAVGWAMIAGGGAMIAGGGAINFLVVNPAWSDAEAANAHPASVTRAEADAIVSRFNSGRYATIGLIAAGAATAGVGVFLGPLDSHLYFTPTGVGLTGTW
jgi:hypothetical protein